MFRELGPRSFLGKHAGVFFKTLKPYERLMLERARGGCLSLDGFDSVKLNMVGPYSKDIVSSRTWWFRFNQLPTLSWGSGVWDGANEAHDFIDFNFSVIENWINHHADDLPLKWHDHASAIRLRNLVDWFITVARYSSTHDGSLWKLIALIGEHVQWLSQEKNYSRHTNHGFEQARYLLSVVSELTGLPDSISVQELALARLQDEIDFAFTRQGVHVENSPGYQWFMIKVLQETKTMLEVYGLALPDVDFEQIVGRAEDFLEAIALPDNSLPLIGDTQFKKKQNSHVAALRGKSDRLSDVGVYDYSESGYVIVKDTRSLARGIHLIFKNTHLSDYHRHNDDLSVHLAVGDAVFFGDAGLYSHNQMDLGRRYAKSAWAHTTVFPTLEAARVVKRRHLRALPTLERTEEGVIAGVTWLYSPVAVLRRELLWKVDKGLRSFNVTDILLEGERDVSLVSCFLVPDQRASVSVDNEVGMVMISIDKVGCEIRYDPRGMSAHIHDRVCESSQSLSDYVVVSPAMGVKSSARRVVFEWNTGYREASFDVGLYELP